MSEPNSKEVNVLDVVFKEKTNKVAFTEQERKKVLEFGKEYWDDPDFPGCGGYHYDGRWKEPAQKLLSYFNIQNGGKVLDLCCGKGFLLYEMSLLNPSLELCGVDVSEYAIENSKEEIKDKLLLGNVEELPFEDNSFDLVVCLNSLYILPLEKCILGLKEIQRVGKNKFVQVNSFRSDQEKVNLTTWDASANVVKSTKEWEELFTRVGYDGHYYWTIFL